MWRRGCRGRCGAGRRRCCSDQAPQAERVYADLSADGAPISAGQLAAAAGLSASYARALIAQFQSRPPAAVEQNGRRPAPADADPEAGS